MIYDCLQYDIRWFKKYYLIYIYIFINTRWFTLLLMEEILHQLIGSLSHYLQGFIHPRWCRISSINSMICIFIHTCCLLGHMLFPSHPGIEASIINLGVEPKIGGGFYPPKWMVYNIGNPYEFDMAPSL